MTRSEENSSYPFPGQPSMTTGYGIYRIDATNRQRVGMSCSKFGAELTAKNESERTGYRYEVKWTVGRDAA